MRAPGIAALALGAVIALSCTLGVSSRSEAAPLDDPVTASASDPAAASAPNSEAPTESASADVVNAEPSAPPTADPTAAHSTVVASSPAPSESANPAITPAIAPPAVSSSPAPQQTASDADGWHGDWRGWWHHRHRHHHHHHGSGDPNDYDATPVVAFGSGAFTPSEISPTMSLTGGATSGSTAIFVGDSDEPQQSCDWTSGQTCHFVELHAGVWRLESSQAWSTGQGAASDSGPSDSTVEYLVVPAAPTVSATDDDGFDLHGTGDHTGDTVRVSLSDGTPVCSAIVHGGSWSCRMVVAPTAVGTYSYLATETDTASCGGSSEQALDCELHQPGAVSAFSATVVYAVEPDPTPTPTPTPSETSSPTPTATATPTPASEPLAFSISLKTLATWNFTVTGIDLGNVHPGDHFTVSGDQLPPGSIISGELHSKVVLLGAAVVGTDGTFSLPVSVPSDFAPGPHELIMTLTPPGLESISSVQDLTVIAPVAESGDDSDSAAAADAGAAGGATGDGRTRNGEELPTGNILTHGLNSIADVLAPPEKIPAAIEIGLVLLIFAILPGHLLNATLAEQYQKLSTRRARRRPSAPAWWTRLTALLQRAPVLGGLALTTITALLFGLADPRFGFSLVSLRLFLGLAIALAVVTYLTNVTVGRIMRSRWNVEVEVSLRPLGLILTVVGVVVSRVLDFSPGFLVGLVLGLVISEKSLSKHAWRAVLLRTSILLGLALLAWLGFSLFDSSDEGGSFASELAVETLVAITTEAVVGLLVELLPLKLLEGEKLFQKSKVVWGALYLLAVFIFVVAVVPWEGNWATLGSSLWAWIGIVVGFGIVATGIYLFFRIRTHEEPPQLDAEELVPVGSEPE